MNIGNRLFRIRVYAGDHPPPHCHVRWSDGSESLVEIPNVRVIAGKKLTKEAESMIREHIDEICDEYDLLNPKIH